MVGIVVGIWFAAYSPGSFGSTKLRHYLNLVKKFVVQQDSICVSIMNVRKILLIFH